MGPKPKHDKSRREFSGQQDSKRLSVFSGKYLKQRTA